MIDPTQSSDETVTIVQPSVTPVPALFDSPHSGSTYPDDFNAAVDFMKLRRMEDAFVDELYSAAPNFGALLIAARFPRGYIDANRAVDDIDPAEIDGWQGDAVPTEKSRVGKGLIWTRLHGVEPLYDRRLTGAEVAHRIGTYWRPYHAAVADAMDALHARFGCVYHIDCHSMRAQGNAFDPDGETARPDFVVSNHDGKSCSGEFIDLVVAHLRGGGHNVLVNDPYKGAELTRRYADPANGRHSLQIEINRALYMDEMAIEKNAGYDALHAHLSELAQIVSAFAAERGKAVA
jgi:N-formylglutamate deformylase